MTQVFLPLGAGPCAKVNVVATLVTKGGERYESSNFCLAPQTSCPRDAAGYESGEGYHLCEEVCHQPAHAEENVINFAKRKAGLWSMAHADIYVDYHWICDGCKAVAAGYACNVHIGKPPEVV